MALPPASTLAAHLVREHAGPEQAARSQHPTATFGTLLQEILNNLSVPESDLDVNYRLIRVVTDAGLDALHGHARPYAQELVAQAIDSLSVISLTVQRQPELLFHDATYGTEVLQQPALLIWMLPRVLNRLGVVDLSSLWQPVANLLATSLVSIFKALDLSDRSSIVLELYLSELESVLDNSHGVSDRLHLPSLADRLVAASILATAIFRTSESCPALSRMRSIQVLDITAQMVSAVVNCRLSFSDTELWFLLCGQSIDLLFHICQSALQDSSCRALRAFDALGQAVIQFVDAASNRLPPTQHAHLVTQWQDKLKILYMADARNVLPGRAMSFRTDGGHNEQCLPLNGYSSNIAARVKPASRLFSIDERGPANNANRSADKLGTVSRVLQYPYTDPAVPGVHEPNAAMAAMDSHGHYDHIRDISLLLTGKQGDLEGLSDIIARAYPGLSISGKERFHTLLAHCICDHCPSDARGATSPHCVARVSATSNRDTLNAHKPWAHINAILLALLELPESLQTKSFRIAFAHISRALLLHAPPQIYCELATSPLGSWSLRALSSSTREVRLAAIKTLICFLREDLPGSRAHENRRIALDYLRTLSEKPALAHHETLILAWGQIAVTCGDTELNLALLRLVEYLGHPNNLLCALAYGEIEAICAVLSRRADLLFRPFWRTIAISVVRDIFKIPQKIQQLVDVLGMSVNQFLVSTQIDTLPPLVLSKQTKIIERIAVARGPNFTALSVCLQTKSTLAAIVALLLTQPFEDVETTTCAILSAAIPGAAINDLSGIVRLEQLPIATEVLKIAGDLDATHKPRAYHAIQVLAAVVDRKATQSKAGTKQGKLLINFFETNILGIMNQISETIGRAHDVIPRQEKLRCLKAIEETFALTRTHVSVAIPQIRACLQSAVDQIGLLDTAVTTWLALMRHLEVTDVVHLMDHLLAVVVRHWTDMSPIVQQNIHDTIAWLLKSHNTVIRENVLLVPSLASIPLLSKFEGELRRHKNAFSKDHLIQAYTRRLKNENPIVIDLALCELVQWLQANEEYLYDAALNEPPSASILALIRTLLDVCVAYGNSSSIIRDTAARCLGVIGCQDPNRAEVHVTRRQILVFSNFDKAAEVIEWVAVLLEDVMVPAFRATTSSPRAQGFLAYVMQELLRFSGFDDVAAIRSRPKDTDSAYHRWMGLSEQARNILTPFLTSRYVLNSNTSVQSVAYPIFSQQSSYQTWLRTWVGAMLTQAVGENAKAMFPTISRVTKGHDLSISRFMLPYAALNIVLGGTVKQTEDIAKELLTVLSAQSDKESDMTVIRSCSEDIFSILDYMSRWLQEKQRSLANSRAAAARAGQTIDALVESGSVAQIDAVQKVVDSIPADIIAQRAIECGSFSRALFHWERYIRAQDDTKLSYEAWEANNRRLQTIYSNIDEPDGLDGISTLFDKLSDEQHAFQHQRAGRWSAAQSWFEFNLEQERSAAARPDLQVSLLTCLKESGQYQQLIRAATIFSQPSERSRHSDRPMNAKAKALAVEASWSMNEFEIMRGFFDSDVDRGPESRNMNIARILYSLSIDEDDDAAKLILDARTEIARSMTDANTTSLQACHDSILHLHALHDIESQYARYKLSDERIEDNDLDRQNLLDENRLSIIGPNTSDKLFLLGIRRAVLQIRRNSSVPTWLATSKLARHANLNSLAHYAVISARHGPIGAVQLEHAKLTWRDEQHKQAIRMLEGAIDRKVFAAYDTRTENHSVSDEQQLKQNVLTARAHLLLAKWRDASGQSQTREVTQQYQRAAKMHARWEKGHYYLGRHYNKLLEAEKSLPVHKRSDTYLSGEIVKLVIENYIRSIPFGTKYWHQTLPKLVTLWLDLGLECTAKPRDMSAEMFDRRVKFLNTIHLQLKKYFDRVPPYVYYTALPQFISRIAHPNRSVYDVLSLIVTKIVHMHPSQALWTLLPVAKATSTDRAKRGQEIIQRLKDPKSKSKSDDGRQDLRTMVVQAQRLQDALLHACDVQLEGKSSMVSLSRDLSFSHKLAPSSLVVPFQFALTANIPMVHDAGHIRSFRAFAQDKVTIESFSDEVMVLNSLQRPRKLTLRGSDGKSYGLLCKPKDDLRKDQRLMEFNTMINRALKRDPESSKRRLYIKTYGVTPLSEESGTIEWVEGIKPLRDILMKIYARKGIQPNYTELRTLLNEASEDESKVGIFSERILGQFQPVLHEWFVQLFPEPHAWFAARLRYSRSAAVMSIVGYVLGLGDRHGENILLEEGSGGVFHVDFNCLFDKGFTFEKPEVVPFRLTHNMVDAMGCYRYEGPFRRSAELTTGLLRQHMDTLMNILETFVHDPTTDFIGHKRKRPTPGVPETPQEVLDSVRGKLRGYLRGESVPLSIEGQVDALIVQATDPWNLCRMYIGWLSML